MAIVVRFTIMGLLFSLLGGCATAPPEQLSEVTRASIGEQSIQRVTVVASNYWFRPERVIVKLGIPVELSVRKEPGIIPHSFVIHAPEAGINANIVLGAKPEVINFVPRKVGAFEFYCDKPGLFESHRQMGMVGVIEVTP
ncbi:MAG: quinol oxidase [Nitrococcus mobilis]|nr:quinol oxidase [Nitrococcus mobilis]